jgi:hypothetical protein
MLMRGAQKEASGAPGVPLAVTPEFWKAGEGRLRWG